MQIKTLTPAAWVISLLAVLHMSPTAHASSDCENRSGDSVVINVGREDPIGGLAVRAAPNPQAQIKAVIPAAGTGVAIGSCHGNGWCEVTFECVTGWSRAAHYLAPRDQRLYRVTNVSPKDPEGLNIRSGPGATYSPKGNIPYNGDGIVLHDCQADGGWCLVTYGEISGWASRQYLAPMTVAAESAPTPLLPPTRGGEAVPMVGDGGAFKVPVTINGQLTVDFIVDSGAADVSIPADVVMTLWRTGSIAENDFLDSQTYRLADGSTVPSRRFRIRSLKVGGTVLENVTGSIAPVAGDLLLGQSFLTRFKSWSIDNQRQALVLN
jgi:clan AA aspartic protease (TIGR02281 family)